MATNQSWWQKYRKDVFLGLAVISILVIAVMGWHWTDTANNPFWSNFWVVAAIISAVIWIAGWLYLRGKDKHRKL